MGLSHFLLLPFLHGDKTQGTQLWTERSSSSWGGGGGAALGEQDSRPACFLLTPRFLIFPISWDLSFLSPRPPNLSQLLFSFVPPSCAWEACLLLGKGPGTWLARSVEGGTLDLGAGSLRPTLGIDIT
uniref:Uncharacterized protein n=1 Tax=Panthera leo TaxID=9689 RepID=A0A8C8XGK2_PANLE